MNKKRNKKKFSSYHFLFILLFFTIIACNKDEEIIQDDSQNNEVSLFCEITNPENEIEVPQGTNLFISANVIDSIYLINSFKIFIDSSEIVSIDNVPYQYNYNTTNLDSGTYVIKIVAENSIGITQSDEVSIKIILSEFGIEGSGVIDIDGNQYRTAIIGQQEWISENLKVTHYPDGTEIPYVSEDNNWESLNNNDDAYCWFQDDTCYKETYGALYTWSAAMHNTESSNLNPSGIQGVCPDGWHLPSDAEWNELFNELGGYEEARGKLKEIGTFHWNYPNIDATNESGFWALPGGYRSSIYGNCMSMGNTGYWWCSTSNTYFYLTNDNNTDIHLTGASSYGFNVRCVKN